MMAPFLHHLAFLKRGQSSEGSRSVRKLGKLSAFATEIWESKLVPLAAPMAVLARRPLSSQPLWISSNSLNVHYPRVCQVCLVAVFLPLSIAQAQALHAFSSDCGSDPGIDMGVVDS